MPFAKSRCPCLSPAVKPEHACPPCTYGRSWDAKTQWPEVRRKRGRDKVISGVKKR